MKRSPFRRRTPMRRGARPVSPRPRSIATPYAALGPQEPIRIVTACETGPVQKKPETVRSEAYLAWIREQPCAWHFPLHRSRCATLCIALGVPLRMEASHHPPAGDGGMGIKTDDFRCLPLCAGAHHLFTAERRIKDLRGAAMYGWIEGQLWTHIARWRAGLEAF